MKEDDPVRIKRLDYKLDIDRKMWLSERATDVMKEGLYAKFKQNPKLCQILLETEGRTLVECNKNDSVFGIGHSDEAQSCTTWAGQNLLGKLLGETRSRLLREATNSY